MDDLPPRAPAPPPASPSPLSTIGPVERELVVERLSHHFAHDLISVEEFEYRVAAAYNAPTRAALAALTADLPPVDRELVSALARAPIPRRVSAMLSNVEQSHR